jgi:hypothetical protein
MIRTIDKTRKIRVNEGKLLGVRCIGTTLGVKVGIKPLPAMETRA